jgi:hypothetical protein
MIAALKVMTCFKINLSTHDWDSAFLLSGPARRHRVGGFVMARREQAVTYQ